MLGVSALDGGAVLAGPEFNTKLLARVLFPGVDVLSSKQLRDIEHLQQHVRTGGDCFVTLDSDFITGGRREALRKIGIWVFRPDELVEHLRAGYGELPPEEVRSQ